MRRGPLILPLADGIEARGLANDEGLAVASQFVGRVYEAEIALSRRALSARFTEAQIVVC